MSSTSQPERPAAPVLSVDKLQAAIGDRRARTGVIGLGYVGLPLLVSLAEAGFEAVGIDIDREKVERLGRGESCVADVADESIRTLIADGRLRATADFSLLRDLDAICICVPTPLSKTRDPDLSHVGTAVQEVARCLRPGQLVVLESTTWPGTVERFVLVLDTRNALAGVTAGHGFRI